MDDVAAQELRVPFAERLGPHGLDPATGLAGHPPPEDVVLAARVDADDRPHLVIVGHDGHQWFPDDVEDGEIGRPVERLDLRAPNRSTSNMSVIPSLPHRLQDALQRSQVSLDHTSVLAELLV